MSLILILISQLLLISRDLFCVMEYASKQSLLLVHLSLISGLPLSSLSFLLFYLFLKMTSAMFLLYASIDTAHEAHLDTSVLPDISSCRRHSTSSVGN